MANCGKSCSNIGQEDEDKIKVIKVSVGKKGIVSKVNSGKHTFYTDETETWGGKDSYPDPWDYIIGGLGSCIAIAIRQYATKHFIMLDRAEITLEYSYNLNSVASPYKIEKRIKFFGNLSDEEKERLILISESPAEKMLIKGIDITTVMDNN